MENERNQEDNKKEQLIDEICVLLFIVVNYIWFSS